MIKAFKDDAFKNSNAYLIYNPNGQGILIDTAYKNYKKIIEFVKENEIELTDVFITHGYFDHFYGISEICKETNNPKVYIGKDDLLMLFDPKQNLSDLYEGIERYSINPIKNLIVIQNDCQKKINEYTIDIFYKKGHTNGSLILHLKERDFLFTGDAIFLNKDPIAFLLNSSVQIHCIETMQWIFKNLSRESKVFPGHYEHGFTLDDVLKENKLITKLYLKDKI